MDPPLRRTKRLSFLFVGAGPRPARGRGTPQGGFSRPSADSPSAPPTALKKIFQDWVEEALGPPAGIRTSHHLLGQARRGSGTAPAAIFANPGPSGPDVIVKSHSDFARRKYCSPSQVCVPRNGGPGVSRHGERSSPLRRPPVAFCLLCRHGQSRSPPGRRNLSAHNRPNPKSAPSSVTASPCHLPPRGKA